MANEISTAGISIGYCIEATAGSRPSSSYTQIPNIKSIGDMNPEPATYEVTDLSDTEWKRYIGALKDVGGALALTANFTPDFQTAWGSLVTAAESGASANPAKAMWYCITVPNWSKKFYFAGMPSAMGFPQTDTDQVFSGDVYITPNKIEGWA